MKNINIALCSIGDHAIRNILPAIDKISSVNLVGAYSRNSKTLLKQSQKYDCHAYSNFKELLEDNNVDAVYLTSPNAMHYDQIKQSLLHGKHVIVEKSALTSLAQTQEIIQLAKKKNLIVFEAFMYLFHSQFRELKKILDNKMYGKILSLEANFGFPHLDDKNIRYSKNLDGGALNDAGAYTVSAVLNLMGFDSKLIFSILNTEKNYEVDTSGIALFQNDSVIGLCNWAMGANYKNEIRVWCQFGSIIVSRAFSKPQDYQCKIEIHKDNTAEEIIIKPENHFINMIDVFVENIALQNYALNYDNILFQSIFMQKIRDNN
jgi:dTDP-3,4-didehydro-2,6-dideoxy-alpha-D-glucose 3-reductase